MFAFRVLNTVPYSNQVAVKDVVAHVHSYFTCNLLIGLAVLLSYKQFGGRPIECMVPTDFTPAWAQYAENYCWSQDTYFVHPKKAIIDETGDKKASEKVSYYQWMPFFLLFNAACFKLPCYIWKYFASQSGMRVGEILRISSDDENAVPETKKGNIEALCHHLQGGLRFHKRLHKRNIVPHKVLRFLNIKYSTYYVVFIYFIAKSAFLINVVWQLKLLTTYILPEQMSDFGYKAWRSLLSGNDTWMESGLFPRVSMCDFEVREMGNIQTHTVQCVLLINIFTEKIFVILWAWYLLLCSFTACNLFSWMFVVFSRISKEHFLINHLEMCETDSTPFDKNHDPDRQQVDKFLDVYLGLDGIFILQLIAQHADVVFTTELIGALWRSHQAIEQQREALKKMNTVLPLLNPSDPALAMQGSRSRKSSLAQPRKKSSPHGTDSPRAVRRQGSISNLDELDMMSRTGFGDSDEEDRASSNKTSPKKRQSVKRKDTDPRPSMSDLRRGMIWSSGDRSDPFPNPAYSKYHGLYDKKRNN